MRFRVIVNTSTSYSYDVQDDGTWDNRKTFSYVDSGVPDGKYLSRLWISISTRPQPVVQVLTLVFLLMVGVHCDTHGNVYGGCGDGIHVWNPSGKLLGKIYLGEGSANFNFAGNGRMVICAETNLYYAEFAAVGGSYIY